jgi:hypothetical protein
MMLLLLLCRQSWLPLLKPPTAFSSSLLNQAYPQIYPSFSSMVD